MELHVEQQRSLLCRIRYGRTAHRLAQLHHRRHRKEISLPYGLAVNPETKEIFVCDATNYVTPGYLYCFTPEGKLKWKVRTGDIPAHIAFSSEPYYY